jgi:hypothetical protein
VGAEVLSIVDEDGEEVGFDADESATLLALAHNFDAATVSACPECRSRVLAAVAVVDLLQGALHPRGRELVELAEDAPTLHLYVQDLTAACGHHRWRDPGFAEWSEVLDDLVDTRRGMR